MVLDFFARGSEKGEQGQHNGVCLGNFLRERLCLSVMTLTGGRCLRLAIKFSILLMKDRSAELIKLCHSSHHGHTHLSRFCKEDIAVLQHNDVPHPPHFPHNDLQQAS